ncbi:MAG: hypothetical protein LBU83_07050 [Bacteroidales bacterium]|jgi:hypothetical protein|nr:hypothetical protein [Bacteroidales bacterium]
MPNYANIQKEETLKSLVHSDYFSKFGYEPNINNIDFVVTDKKSRDDLFSESPGSSCHYLWAEAKKGTHDVFDMYTQLVLTCKKTYEKADFLAPPWLGTFDETRISFVSFHDMLPIFSVTDFNWNTTPSNHEAADFQKAKLQIKNLIGAKLVIYNFGSDDKEIKEFIKTHFTSGSTSIQSPITKDNFVQIFIKWVKEVKPLINISKEEWGEFKQKGILDCDFYRADIMSSDGNTITEKLKIVLKNDNYKFQENISGRLFSADIGFTDKGEAYTRFWNRYERPPALEYQQYIIDRRDLLVPQNIREVKGSFFTPKIWADKSKEYLADIFGENWQDEYYIWDCAAGTGNLLAGLTNKYNIWASDIDQGNVETIQSLIDIDENLDLLPTHVFQFDFLNDKFDNLPEDLKEIINDPEKRKKLIIYINPPYAEASSSTTSSGTGSNKANVAKIHKMSDRFMPYIGRAINELFAQFFCRIYKDIPNCILASFSTLKYVSSSNFINFREFFNAEFKNGFVCCSNTFDNVQGQFPIGFLIWVLNEFKFPNIVEVDIMDLEGKRISNKKRFYSINQKHFLSDWIKKYYDTKNNAIGYLTLRGTDMQNNKYINICSKPAPNDVKKHMVTPVTKINLLEMSVFHTVRQCITNTWLNNRDQFLFPTEHWKNDYLFQYDCLVFTLFGGQNKISSAYCINHWIPFTEKEVNAKNKFKSNFMSNYLKDKKLSKEAQEVMNTGLELWKYYHSVIKDNRKAPVDASFYDIREFFQGRSEKGIMKSKSTDTQYNVLIKALRDKLKKLGKKIEPKIYKYGFLKK